MDNKRTAQLISDNLKNIYGYAFARLYDKDDVDDLTSEIVCEVLKSAERIKNDEAFWGFLWKIAENTFRKFIRCKKSRNELLPLPEADEVSDTESSPEDEMIERESQNESLMLLRRELSLLSKTHREVCLAFYFQNKSCKEIAAELKISLEMVKYHLFKTRQLLKEGIGMERTYGEKSYRPVEFEIDFWGTKAGDDREYQDFSKRKIKGNILLAAYYHPMTTREIGMELGVALPYLEDEIRALEERQYIINTNGKYLTNIPVFTSDCTKAINDKLKTLTAQTARDFIDAKDDFFDDYGKRFDNENLARWQKALLCLHFALINSDELDELPKDGPYSLVNGGGGRGVIWGRCFDPAVGEKADDGIQGLYNGFASNDGMGSVIAMNFNHTLNAQLFMGRLVDPVVCAALGRFDYLSDEWKKELNDLNYIRGGNVNFAVWTREEYGKLKSILGESILNVTDLSKKTSDVAVNITADIAPAHIRKTAEYVGAFVYRFNAVNNLVNALYEMGWLKPVADWEKPAICVVKNKG